MANYYYSVVRDSDGIMLAMNHSKSALAPCIIPGSVEWERVCAPWLARDDNGVVIEGVRIVRMDVGAEDCQGCEGINEDYAVEWGECDVCGRPLARGGLV